MPGDELYCYPGGDVLKNKLNITDDELLHDVERKLTAIRIDELLRRRVRGSFDFEHLKAIHFFIFQDLYAWAGQPRKINIAKGVMFCDAMFIDDMAKEIFTGLDGFLFRVSQRAASFPRGKRKDTARVLPGTGKGQSL